MLFLHNVRVNGFFNGVDNVTPTHAKLVGVVEGNVEKSEDCLGQIDSMFAEKEIIQGGKVDGFVHLEEHVVKEVDSCVELDIFGDFPQAIIAESLEESFEKPDELSDLSHTLENIGESSSPRVGEIGIR
jgi:hypothetical protein